MPELAIGDTIEAIIIWLRTNASGFFDALAGLVGFLINQVQFLLQTPPWWALTILAVALAFWARGAGFAAFTAAGMLIIEGMGLWSQAMNTLALALLATLLASLIGIPVGIAAGKSNRISSIVRPILDFMQTLPVFVYLIPAITFFGIGLVPATIATVVWATAPVVRLVELGIRQVDEEMVEASLAFGAKPGQLLWHVQLPLAIPSIMMGINQAIMMSLSMVVIASMVGAGGLGAVVWQAISSLDISAGFEGGLAVVFIAVFLDRTTRSFPRAAKTPKAAHDAEKADSPEEAEQETAEQTATVKTA